MSTMKMVPFETLIGKIIVRVDGAVKGSDEIAFHTSTGEVYAMQEVEGDTTVDDVCGEIEAIIGSPVLKAEVKTNHDSATGGDCMWTFYDISTIKCTVTIRWYGDSGYYSESVSFVQQEAQPR